MGYQFTEEENRFVAKDEEGKEAGEITFTRSEDNLLIIDHTGVNFAHQGQGLAAQLVSRVVEKAKEENIKIKPDCAYAKQQFDKHESYKEVLYS